MRDYGTIIQEIGDSLKDREAVEENNWACNLKNTS